MKVTFIVNLVTGIGLKQTTLHLIRSAAERGYTVWVTDVCGLSCNSNGQVQASVRQLPTVKYESYHILLDRIRQTVPHIQVLSESDVILIRTNPARDNQHTRMHTAMLSFLRMVRDSGTLILNDPDGLNRAGSKLYLQELPSFVRPHTLVSINPIEIIEFIEELNGPAVLKPLQGTRGRDVFMVQSAHDKNLLQIIDVLMRQDFVMVQSFIPEAAEGDTRVLVMNGEILEVDGRPAAFRRIPQGSDFRSNIDVGGKTEPAVISPIIRNIVAQVGTYFRRDGLFLVGLDFIGSKICEVNAYSPGGLRAAKKIEGKEFSAPIWDELEKRILDR